MNDEKTRIKAIEQIKANDFRRVNGQVMRMIVLLFKVKWFQFSELETALASNKITREEIYESLDYMESEGYLEVRSIEVRHPVRLSDMDEEEIEFKLTGEGKLVAYGIKTDDGIEL